jgi:hypothetical protein
MFNSYSERHQTKRSQSRPSAFGREREFGAAALQLTMVFRISATTAAFGDALRLTLSAISRRWPPAASLHLT